MYMHIYIYNLESRWRNSHNILLYHGPSLSHILGVAPSTFATVYSVYFCCGRFSWKQALKHGAHPRCTQPNAQQKIWKVCLNQKKFHDPQSRSFASSAKLLVEPSGLLTKDSKDKLQWQSPNHVAVDGSEMVSCHWATCSPSYSQAPGDANMQSDIIKRKSLKISVDCHFS